jgi:hypothetical protein
MKNNTVFIQRDKILFFYAGKKKKLFFSTKFLTSPWAIQTHNL